MKKMLDRLSGMQPYRSEGVVDESYLELRIRLDEEIVRQEQVEKEMEEREQKKVVEPIIPKLKSGRLASEVTYLEFQAEVRNFAIGLYEIKVEPLAEES